MSTSHAKSEKSLATRASREGSLGMYRRQARIYDWTRWAFLRGHRRAVEAMELSKGDRVLDVGCGTGLGLELLREAVGEEGEVVGADQSPHMLALAARRIERQGWSNVRIVETDALHLEEIDPPAAGFDGVFLAYSLSQFVEWRKALDGAASLVAPGGGMMLLDFGDMKGLGPLAPVARWWLGRCHVDTGLPWCSHLEGLTGPLEVDRGPFGWFFAAGGRKPDSTNLGDRK